MNRRETLALGAGALSLSVAGCTDAIDSVNPMSSSSTAGWTGYRGDPANTGVRDADAGPGDSLSMEWEVTHEDILYERHEIEAEELDLPVMSETTSWPVLAEEVVVWTQGYTWQGESGSERETVVVAADVEEGSIVWVESFVEEPPDNWFAPMVSDGSILLPNLIDGNLGLTVHDPGDGSEQDRHDWGLSLRANQPTVAEGTVFVEEGEPQDARLYAFDASDGTSLWDVSTVAPRPYLPELAVADDAVLSFDGEDGAMVARDVDSGEERWRARVELPTTFATGQPGVLGPATVSDHGIYAGGSLEQLFQRDLGTVAAFDPDDGDTQFTHLPPGTEEEGPWETLLGPDASEAEIEAVQERVFDGEGFASVNCQPLVVDDQVLAVGWGEVGDASGTILYGMDPDAEEAVWGVEVGSTSYAPVAAGDVVYVLTGDSVEAVSTDGEHLDSLVLESEAFSVDEHTPSVELSPALGQGTLFVPTMHGIVAVS